MSKRLNAKFKVNRRLGCNLWGRAKSPVNTRNTAPGQHGMNRKKPTDYGIQLLAKQKLRMYYGNIQEKQFRRIYEKAMNMRGDTSENIIGLLERRLDAVVYRMKLAPSVFAARQLISHGHINVNGKSVNVSSYLVSEGDEIGLAQAMRTNPVVMSAVQSSERDAPAYVEIDYSSFKGRFLSVPKLSDVPYPVMMEPNLVVEFYSR